MDRLPLGISFFSHPIQSRLIPGPIQPYILWVTGPLFPGVNLSRHKGAQSNLATSGTTPPPPHMRSWHLEAQLYPHLRGTLYQNHQAKEMSLHKL